MYLYRGSIKSDRSDEIINTYIIRPAAGIVVRFLYPTPVTPNQVTIASIMAGFISAYLYLKGTPHALFIGGLFIALKDILDSADGQLARARSMCSRIGRFLDSIGDFFVDLAVFVCIGFMLYRSTGDWTFILTAFLGLAGITLRVSYHVFYQVQYLHLKGKYTNNRISENVREEDIEKGGVELKLQQMFQFIYGWQDRLMSRIDAWSRKGKPDNGFLLKWYSDAIGLRISGLLGLGTELFTLTICSVFNKIELYLYLNIFLMNAILIAGVLYRRIVLLRILMQRG